MKKWIFLLLFLLIPIQVFGEFGKLQPFSKSDGTFRGDIRSQLGGQFPYQSFMGSEGPVTDAHENCHQVHSRIRNTLHVANGYYLFKGNIFTIGKSGVTLAELANNIPQNQRGGSYDLYLVQQRQYWNEDAFYIFDEMVAYMNGSFAGFQENAGRDATFEFEHVVEFRNYAGVLQRLCRQKNFKEQQQLDKFIGVLDNRILYIKKTFKWK